LISNEENKNTESKIIAVGAFFIHEIELQEGFTIRSKELKV